MRRIEANDYKVAAPMVEALPVLLVGASGRVGSMVAHHWTKGAEALPIVTQFRDGPAQPDRLIWDPLSGPRALLDAMSASASFKAMVMLAGVLPGRGRNLSVNRALAAACLEAASLAGILRVLFASSSAVYGAGRGEPLAETAACNPVNAYGAAKLEMELACAPWRERGMDLCMLRIGNVAGADALLLNLAKSADGRAIEIDIFDDGRGPVRSYIGAKTLASVLLSLCMYSGTLPDILNIGTPEPVSMDALADSAQHPWTPRVPKGPTPQHIILDCNRLRSLHPFHQQDSRPEEMVRQWQETVQS